MDELRGELVQRAPLNSVAFLLVTHVLVLVLVYRQPLVLSGQTSPWQETADDSQLYQQITSEVMRASF